VTRVGVAIERLTLQCPVCGDTLSPPDEQPGVVQQVTCACGAQVRAIFSRPQALETAEQGDVR